MQSVSFGSILPNSFKDIILRWSLWVPVECQKLRGPYTKHFFPLFHSGDGGNCSPLTSLGVLYNLPHYCK